MSEPSIKIDVIKGEGLATLLPSNNVRLLIDADMLLYRACWATNEKPFFEAQGSFSLMMNAIIEELDSDDYICYFSGKGNIRNEVYPWYKANRKDKEKPVHLAKLREWVEKNYPSESQDGLEADDLIADNMVAGDPFNASGIGTHASKTTICVTQDKDLLQLEGWNYNFVDKKLVWQDKRSAEFMFNCQLITGDRVDNIPGLSEKRPKKGIGPAGAVKLLKPNYLDKGLQDLDVLSLYTEKYGEEYGTYMMWLNWYMLKVGSTGREKVLEMLSQKRGQMTDDKFEELING